MGGGRAAPVWRGNEPKKTGARSARARTRGQNPLVIYIDTVLLKFCPDTVSNIIHYTLPLFFKVLSGHSFAITLYVDTVFIKFARTQFHIFCILVSLKILKDCLARTIFEER